MLFRSAFRRKPSPLLIAIRVLGAAALVRGNCNSPTRGSEAEIAPPARRRPFALEANLRRSEEHTSELQSLRHLVCRLLLEKKKTIRVIWCIELFVCGNSKTLAPAFLLRFSRFAHLSPMTASIYPSTSS